MEEEIATVSLDLNSVTAFGRIESCMKCHAETKHDRLFGPKWLQHHDAAARDKSTPAKR